MKQRRFSISSNDNTLFVTEQCNNHCLMCCQPPKTVDDIEQMYLENLERIKSAPSHLPIIGVTGGEPTLLGHKLITLLQIVRQYLPETDIHLLTNGRHFVDKEYARQVVETCDGHLVVGVPLHSDYEGGHDLIAGVRGAYAETMHGLYNLAAVGACIELRVVMNKMNYQRFKSMARFIHKNLPFVAWTAFMGMERIGYAARVNSGIWMEPKDYVLQLADAVLYLDAWHHDVAIYNIPFCLLPEELHSFARKSISDWKNFYPALCAKCVKRGLCCGLFSTSTTVYKGLNPFE